MTRTGLIFGDRYRLDERIAAGSVGQVWRAADLLLQRPVAVKLLRPEYADHSETLTRFRNEAEHARALRHPCVAQVYDYGSAGPGAPPYLVMELVDGQSLAAALAAGPLEPAHALDVIAQAARGLHAAHGAGLVHRDVKPGNILLSKDGQVKVTDFGIAHVAGQTPVTSPGLVVGTTLYMAPERISGGPGTPASDLYALGIVLHECLTGIPPYEGSPTSVMAAHLYLPLPALPAGLPPELGTLVAQLTAKDPARRISDAGELAARAARLRDSLPDGQPPAAAPPASGAAHPATPAPAFPRPPAAAGEPVSQRPAPAPGRTAPDGGARGGAGTPGAQPARTPASMSTAMSSAAGPARQPGAWQPSAPQAGTRQAGPPLPGAPRAGTRQSGTRSPARPARHAHGGRPARGAHGRSRRPLRGAAGLAAGAVLLTGLGLAALLASGVLGTAPAMIPGPSAPAAPGGIPSAAASPAPGGSAGATPGPPLPVTTGTAAA